MATAADALLTAVRAAVPADVIVYDTIVPGVASQRYVVLYIPAEARSAQGVDGVSDYLKVSFDATSVASNVSPAYAAAECRWLAAAVRDALVDLVITAAGMQPARVRMEGSQPPRPDEATPDKKVYATAQFSFESIRA